MSAEVACAPLGRRDNRTAILDAAARLFSQRGVAAVSMAELCRAAKVSNGTLFHFFGSKDALVAALYLRALEAYQETIARTLEAAPTARDGVRDLVRAHVRWVLANPGPARTLHELRRGEAEQAVDAAIAERNDTFAARVGAWLKPHVERGELRRVAPDVLVAVLFGPVQVMTRDWLRSGKAKRLRASADELADAAWAALAP